MTVTFPNDAKITQETRQMAVSKKYSTFKIALFFFFPPISLNTPMIKKPGK